MLGLEKAALFDSFASVAKALSSGRRVELIDVLAQGERSVDTLATETKQSVANASQHLQVLARSGLVRSRRDGNRVLYRLAGEGVEVLWEVIRDVASDHVAGIDRLVKDYLADRSTLEEVSRPELARRIRGGAVVWDVRPADEYEAGHVPGAVSVPPQEVKRRLRDVVGEKEVVAYCRGPYCVFADEAVRALRKKGVPAARLEGGFPEWRRAGFPVAVGLE